MNRLKNEKSPYLQQHAHNPVNWYPWSDEALQKAKNTDKPLLISIGYSTCHWCHVMEHESFEDASIARFMNDNFINIKVDREERPDLDHLYMEVVQALTGRGGWPLNCFLTPDQKPFFGGTYFPPEGMMGNPSWMQTLSKIKSNFENKRELVESQAEKMINYIQRMDDNVLDEDLKLDEETSFFTNEKMDFINDYLENYFDEINGGFGQAPKFPSTMPLEFLLRYGFYKKNKKSLDHVSFSIDKMIFGGIYDQIGGGLTRYATDDKWLVPHFEKMLYDNGLLVSLLSEAYTYFKHDRYKEYIIFTLDFVERELLDENGGFYAALDADSEGEEGKFYVWNKDEITKLFSKDEIEIIADWFDIHSIGNWEGKSIPNIKFKLEEISQKFDISNTDLLRIIDTAKAELFKERSKRVRPGRDEKILLNWNMLMCSGFIDAYKAIGEERYLQIAVKNIDFVFKKMVFFENNEWKLYHSYKNGQAYTNGFLTDFAYLVKTLIDIYQVTFIEDYINKALSITHFILKNFDDKEKGLFFYTPHTRKDIILRKKEINDAALPSGNSIMVNNLMVLGLLEGNISWQNKAYETLLKIYPKISKHGLSFGRWISAMLQWQYPIAEIAITGEQSKSFVNNVNSIYYPHKLLMMDEKGNSEIEHLKGRFVKGKTLYYLCWNNACQRPVSDLNELRKQLFG